jgi:hypothetical protein
MHSVFFGKIGVTDRGAASWAAVAAWRDQLWSDCGKLTTKILAVWRAWLWSDNGKLTTKIFNAKKKHKIVFSIVVIMF